VELAGGEARTARALDRVRRLSLPAIRVTPVLYGATVGYAVLFAVAAALHYFAFASGRLDLGDMVQAIWSTSHGHLLQVTTSTGHETVRLGAHVDPLLVLLVPLWWLWSSPLMLLVLQALAVSAGALPVYWLGRKHLATQGRAAALAAAYLVYPATQFNAYTPITGFHPVSLAVPLILFAIWFLDEGRLAPFAVFGLLAATTKEEIPLAVGCLGIWYAVRSGRRVAGLSILAAGVAATLVDFLVVIPRYSVAGSNPFASRYQEVGGTPDGIVHKAFTDPGALVHAVATGHKLAFVLLLLVPLLGLWAREPLLLLGAVPELVIDLLSSKPEQTSVGYHYTAGIIPFVIAATVLGAARLTRENTAAPYLVLTAVALVAVSTPIRFIGRDVTLTFHSPGVRAAKAHALSLIPRDASVSASNQLGAYLSTRRAISVFPGGRRASWLVVDRADSTYPDKAAYLRAVDAVEASPKWTTVYAAHGVAVLRKAGT
jgi:uncharacterized membrane protein